MSTSLIAAASAVTVQLVAAGSAAFGLSVIVSVPEPPTVKGCGVDAQAIVNDAAVAVTGSLKVTVMRCPERTSVAGWPGSSRSRSALRRRAPLPVVKLKLRSDGRVVGRVVGVDVADRGGERGDGAAAWRRAAARSG